MSIKDDVTKMNDKELVDYYNKFKKGMEKGHSPLSISGAAILLKELAKRGIKVAKIVIGGK